jgi:hypothetical protein
MKWVSQQQCTLRRSVVTCVAALAGAVALAPSGASAGVTIINPVRNVTSGVNGSGTVSHTAPDAGPFQDAAVAVDSGQGFTDTTSTSIDSVLNSSRLSFEGSYDFTAADQRIGGGEDSPFIHFFGSVAAGAEFALDQAYSYTLTYNLNCPTPPEALEVIQDSEARFFGDNDPSDSLVQPGTTRTGVLQPGQYQLQLNRNVDGFATPPQDFAYSEGYSFILDLKPVGDGGGKPNPVPLPPAVWSGLIVLGAGALNRLRKRRIS